uniref:anthranilate synthase component I n=1 Tax=Tessaracoccus timonensis TaxID=2161816 RepID=UPI000D552AFD|nr:anthranilate synthase component I [Tessaracoccus timonensis]
MISLDEFRARASHRRVIPVWQKLVADDLTPVALFDQLCRDRAGTFLLESAEAGAQGRWSIVGVRSEATLTSRAGEAHWSGRDIAGLDDHGSPLTLLRDALRELATEPDPDLPPFQAGLVGFLGYDIVRHLERLPEHTVDDLNLPELLFLLTSEVAILDHQQGELWLVANAINWDGSPERVDQAYERAAQAIDEMRARVCDARRPLTATPTEPAEVDIRRQRTSAEFEAIVRQAQEEIAAGEAFQIVASQRFDIPTSAHPFDVYRALRTTNPSPYMYYLNLDEFSIVGASPEALVQVRDGVATTRPIAGSRPRGATPHEDRQLAEELVADEKERAEHIMLVDLGRNDLGRICQPGSVVVEEMLEVHRYSHIMHLEAAVTGKLRADCSALDAVLACFPAGTLSGAPKVRAMEIIEQLEVTRRGLYGGVVGYLDFAGNAEVAIAIRTAVIADGVAHVQAGAGVVKDSVPAAEDAECSHKARAVVTAIQKAESWR